MAAQAKILSSEMAIRVTNDALQVFGAAGYSQSRPLERMVRDARMFAIGGGTAQILRTVVASRLLDRRLPQTRDGYAEGGGRGNRQDPPPPRKRGRRAPPEPEAAESPKQGPKRSGRRGARRPDRRKFWNRAARAAIERRP